MKLGVNEKNNCLKYKFFGINHHQGYNKMFKISCATQVINITDFKHFFVVLIMVNTKKLWLMF